MNTQKKHHRARRNLAAIGAVALAATVMSGIGATAANAADLTNPSFSVDNNAISATGVTYTVQLTTATTADIKTVTVTVPTGTIVPDATGAVSPGQVFGLGAGTASLANDTLTYTVTTATSVASATPLYIEFIGLTNAKTAGTYSSTVSTLTDGATTATDAVTNASAFALGNTSTTVRIEVPKSLTFSSDTSAFDLATDPALTALKTVSKAVTLRVLTNAGQGYTLAAHDTGLTNGGTGKGAYTISPAASTGVLASDLSAGTFGFSAVLTSSASVVAALTPTVLSTAGKIIGYTPTTPATIVTATKPTGNTADVLVLTNTVKVDYTTPAGLYKNTITYTVTPTY